MDIERLKFEINGDERGLLVALERSSLPFEIQRVFYLYDTQPNVRRGKHAHKKCNQVLICVSGSCKILLDDGIKKEVVVLDSPDSGIFVPAGDWREMYEFSPGAVLLVLADQPYDEGDYIRDYDEFLKYYSIEK